MWLDPSSSILRIVWCHPCLPDIIVALVLNTNPEGNLTNLDLQLSVIILHEVNLLEECPGKIMAVPHSLWDNTPTIFWSKREASTINPVILDLLCIHAIYSKQFPSTPQYSAIWYRIIPRQMAHLALLI